MSCTADRQQPSVRLTDNHILNMFFHMKTTLNIDDHLMQALKAEAARRGVTMSALVESGLRLVLARDRTESAGDLPPLPVWDSGGFQLDVANRGALEELLSREEPQWNRYECPDLCR